MSRNVCGALVDKGGFGFVPPAKSGSIASAARRTESRVGRGHPGMARHCTLREAHRAFGIGHSVRRKPSEGRAISPCSSGSLPRKGRTQRSTTNHRRVGMGRTAWLKALYYDTPLGPSGSCRGPHGAVLDYYVAWGVVRRERLFSLDSNPSRCCTTGSCHRFDSLEHSYGLAKMPSPKLTATSTHQTLIPSSSSSVRLTGSCA